MPGTTFLSPLAHTATRIIAGLVTLLLAVAGLTVLTAAPAHAETNFNDNGTARITLTVEPTVSGTLPPYTIDTPMTITATVTGANCQSDVPLMLLHLNGAWLFDQPQVGPSVSVSNVHLAAGPNHIIGQSWNAATCLGIDSTVSLSTSLDITALNVIHYEQASVSGHALRGADPAIDDLDYAPVSGVTVDLLDASLTDSDPAVATTSTNAGGEYTLTAPVTTQAEADSNYKIRFTYPDSTVVYYGGSVSAYVQSPSDWATAVTGGPQSWTSSNYDAILATATAPSQTDQDRLCSNVSSQSTDFTTNTVDWEGICETDPSISDVSSRGPENHYDALDGFGYIWFEQADWYQVTADTFTTTTNDGVLTTVLHDDDIYLPDSDLTVDVTVTRTIQGSFARWVVEVRDAVTHEIVNVPFMFGGNLGSDSDTTWTGSGNRWVSDDGRNSHSNDGSPILAHLASASSVNWDIEDGYDEMQLTVSGGQLTYTLAVIDYLDCVNSTARGAANVIAQAIPGNFGTDLATIAGDACATNWVPAPAFGELRAGVAFDQTFPVNSPGLNWSLGGFGWVDGLPSGLDLEIVNEGVHGTAPAIRIYGTPLSEGEYSLLFRAWGDSSFSNNYDEASVVISVLPGTGPSMTNESRICDAEYSSSHARDFRTASVNWDDVCETDPSIDDAETIANGHGDAFDDFGYISFDQGSFFYDVAADSYTSSATGGVLTTVIQDNDIVLPDASVVDVTVTRTIQGSFARWVVEVRDAITGDIADVPFSFEGNLGSDSDTVWNGSGNWRTSDDDNYGDPFLVHYAEGAAAGSVTWTDTDGNTLDDGDGILVVNASGGTLTYIVGVIDYGAFCDSVGTRAATATIAAAMPGNFGQDISAGDNCNSGWPPPVLNELRVGTPFDQTITVASSALDWEYGGDASLENLPAGLSWDLLAGWVAGTPPQVHIYGTPTAVGPFVITFSATDDSNDVDQIELSGTVLGPVQSSDIALNFGVGDAVGGSTATVSGTGLKEGSDFSVIVQSTPQTIGSGVIGADFLLNNTVTFPSNLGAGWHSITLAGTFFDGTALSNILWFQIATDGTLLSTSLTAPSDPDPSTDPSTTTGANSGELTLSGVDVAGGLMLAFSLLLLGSLIGLLWRRRTTAG